MAKTTALIQDEWIFPMECPLLLPEIPSSIFLPRRLFPACPSPTSATTLPPQGLPDVLCAVSMQLIPGFPTLGTSQGCRDVQSGQEMEQGVTKPLLPSINFNNQHQNTGRSLGATKAPATSRGNGLAGILPAGSQGIEVELDNLILILQDNPRCSVTGIITIYSHQE